MMWVWHNLGFNSMTEKNQTKNQLTQANHETNITERKSKQEEEFALHYPKL
jgi:hypothetical protein